MQTPLLLLTVAILAVSVIGQSLPLQTGKGYRATTVIRGLKGPRTIISEENGDLLILERYGNQISKAVFEGDAVKLSVVVRGDGIFLIVLEWG